MSDPPPYSSKACVLLHLSHKLAKSGTLKRMGRPELTASFLRIEANIGLLSRCRPINFEREKHVLQAEWQTGRRRNPNFCYATGHGLDGARAALSKLSIEVRRLRWAELWSSRCEELQFDVELAEAVGQPSMVQLSKRRFNDPEWASQAMALAHDWVGAQPSDDATKDYSDSVATGSLLSRMQRMVSAQRLPFKVSLSESLVSAAATGDGVIWVASGRSIFDEEVPRIVVHEVFGHAWPRVRAALEPCELFAVGAGKGNDVQEGYALCFEAATQTQTVRRRQELGLRHIAAVSVWQGADWVQTVDLLLDLGASLSMATGVALRAHRAGGLAREAIYLQTYCKVRAALERDVTVLNWLGAGRLSLEAIETLRATGYDLNQSCSHVANSEITGM
jgi:hypothetical protein